MSMSAQEGYGTGPSTHLNVYILEGTDLTPWNGTIEWHTLGLKFGKLII